MGLTTPTPDALALSLGMLICLLLLHRWQTRALLDLKELLTDTASSRVSLMKCGQLLALLVSTWVLVRETNHDRLTEWLFGSYMIAWSGANLVSKLIDKKEDKSGTSI